MRNDRERQAYAMIKHRSFVHTRAFDPDLLEKTGMGVDFARVWHAVGWDSFVPIEENGSRLLTIQFLCTLREVDDGVSFRLFGVERYFNWRNFSHLLGVAKMTSHAIFQYNVLAIDDTHKTWTNVIVKMIILRLLGSRDDKEKIGVARPEGPPLR